MAALFQRFDLLICPVATTPAFEHNQQGWRWARILCFARACVPSRLR
jgi:amidase